MNFLNVGAERTIRIKEKEIGGENEIENYWCLC